MIRGRPSLKRGPCAVCGGTDPRRGGFEDAHVFAAGVRGDGKGSGLGCDCKVNILRLCWDCHRNVVHGVNGGWKKAQAVADRSGLGPALARALREAQLHAWARRKGEAECARDTKAGRMARLRIAAAEAAEGRQEHGQGQV